jgi:hypothetical protein
VCACGRSDPNFSQYPGFAAYFAKHPPATRLPDASDGALLERYRPRLFVAQGAEGPIDFYADYVAHGRLTDGAGNAVPGPITRAVLNRHKTDPRAVFVHRSGNGTALSYPGNAPATPVMYGRVDRETFELGGLTRRFTFLTWHAVFRTSGIGAGIAGWKGAVLGIAGDLDDWHQLDHYTAVTLALDERDRPVAVTLQHHNYMRTHLIGRDMRLPDDGRLRVDVAIRSNELYLHRDGRTVRRAVGFLNADTVGYVVTDGDPPFRAADDITDPAYEVDYRLVFLPPSDAFYTFQGFLGEKRLLPGRSGPPGADYNTLPRFKPKHVQMIAYHWHDGDEDFVRWFREPDRGIAELSRRFAALLAQ